MSPFGTKRTSGNVRPMSANARVKQTSRLKAATSDFDPIRTFGPSSSLAEPCPL
jgi:hypothetical protein